MAILLSNTNISGGNGMVKSQVGLPSLGQLRLICDRRQSILNESMCEQENASFVGLYSALSNCTYSQTPGLSVTSSTQSSKRLLLHFHKELA